MAGPETLSCVVVEQAIETNELLGLQMLEVAIREDLRQGEQAKAYRRLMDAHGWSSRVVAEELHVGRASVVRALALLGLLASVQERVGDGFWLLPSLMKSRGSTIPSSNSPSPKWSSSTG